MSPLPNDFRAFWLPDREFQHLQNLSHVRTSSQRKMKGPQLGSCRATLQQPASVSPPFPAALLAQGQYDLDDPAYPEPPYAPYEIESQDYYDYAGNDLSPQTPEEHYQSQQQNQQEVIPAPTPGVSETEPTEPGPLDCQEEQYPCTRLYSIYKPCKQCLNEICFYSLRRVYVINKEICVRTVCAHEELLRADLCRDRFSKCGIMATSGLCQTMATSCARSCGGC
ncbi:microfibrillar-associated protein 2 [Pseudonaja textilis]|uniref:microfibrillar-associated protein 2 n=1 Tax=Pseudonaja textilis TaxID=8673 RepID=UPI000EA9644F|nr:microfibrillar-associated protein 2 [Pseudonaja textilis]